MSLSAAPAFHPATGRRVSCVFAGFRLSYLQQKLAAAIPLETCALKCVLICLAFHADDSGGKCFPSIDTIASWCSLTRQGVLIQLKKLEAAKLITVQSGGGRSRHNQYHLTVNQVDCLTQETVNPVVSLETQTVNPINVNSQRHQDKQSTPLTRSEREEDNDKRESFAHNPTFKEFNDYCQIHGGPPEWYAKDKWLAAEQDNWTKKPKWTAYADRCRGWWMQAGSPLYPDGNKSSNGKLPLQNREEIELQIRRLSAELPILEIKKSSEWQPTREKIWKLQDQLKTL